MSDVIARAQRVVLRVKENENAFLLIVMQKAEDYRQGRGKSEA